MSRTVLVVQTGTANTASVLAGLARVGARAELVTDPDRLVGADRVVLPGVGAFAAAMSSLRSRGLPEALTARVKAGRPTLAICLGLQLLCDESDESPGVAGLGLVPGRVGRFADTVRVPQMGWNLVTPAAACRYLQRGFAYFANSYRLAEAPAAWQTAWSEHGDPFVAAVEKGDVVACQFHPELSGAWGQALLNAWVTGRPAGTPAGGGSC